MDHMGGHEFSRVQTAVNDGVYVACGSLAYTELDYQKMSSCLMIVLMRTKGGKKGGI
jgi:hypothetical protein